MRTVSIRCVVAFCGLLSVSAGAQRGVAVDLAGLLARVGEQVEQYFNRAQSVICKETVHVQSLAADLLGDGSRARQIVSELRIAWEPAPPGGGRPEAHVLRDVVSVNGRAPRPNDELGCMDPKPVSPEPLAMLLPDRQRESTFSWAGVGRVDGRAVAMIDYRSLESGPVKVTRTDSCVTIDVPGRSRGRVWIDQETGDVLRLDEHLTGMIDVDLPPDPRRRLSAPTWMLERADSSIRYKRLTFRDPDEVFMVPASIETVTVIRNAGVPRVRKTQVFSDYRRFVTEGRIVR